MRKLPPRITEERLAVVVPLLKEGDKEVEREIILGHLRLATKIAISRVRSNEKYKGDIDDFISEAYYAVAKAVRKARRGALSRDNNITGYIIDYVKKHIHTLSTKKLMGVPHRTVTYWNSKLDERARHLPICVATISSEQPNEKESDIRVFVPEISDKDEIDRVDIEEILNMLPQTLLERKVLEMRKQGMTIIEIKKEIGYSKSRIQQALSDMEELFDQIMKNIG
jgi:RNA polymerase sigma factor (sigma-70 family)